MKKIIEKLQFLDKSIAGFEIFIIILLLASLIFGEIFAAILRETVHSNVAWIEQCLQYVVLWIGLVGASLATRYKGHINIEIISRFANPNLQRGIHIFLNLFTTIVVFFMMIASYNYLQDIRLDYNKSQGQKNYIALDSFSVYHCPESSNEMQLKYQKNIIEMSGYAEEIVTLLNKNNINMSSVKESFDNLQESLSHNDSLAEWQKNWFLQQWENNWKSEWDAYWNTIKDCSNKEKETACKPFRSQWQAKWLQNFWTTKGEEIVENAWDSNGNKEWQEQEDDSDYTEEEFAEEWKSNYIENEWKTNWKKLQKKDWNKTGRNECFETVSLNQWLQKKWKDSGIDLWKKMKKQHGKTYLHGGLCPVCKTEMVQEILQFPRWWLLVILPFTLLVMTFRFFLQMMILIICPEKSKE